MSRSKVVQLEKDRFTKRIPGYSNFSYSRRSYSRRRCLLPRSTPPKDGNIPFKEAHGGSEYPDFDIHFQCAFPTPPSPAPANRQALSCATY